MLSFLRLSPAGHLAGRGLVRFLLGLLLLGSGPTWAQSIDPTFNPTGTGANSSVLSMVVQGDGKILIGGAFTTYTGMGRNRIARLNADAARPTITGFAASPNPVCAGSPSTFTATLGNVTGSYSYTLTNGTSPLTGSATL